MLLYESRTPKTPNDDAPLIVLMHGRGASRFDLLPLADQLPDDAHIIFPEAPFAAAQWGYGPGSAWYRFMGRNRPDAESFSASLDALQELVAGFGAARVVLGGFSQGGTMSIGYALAFPGTIAAVLNFSGFLPDHERVPVEQHGEAPGTKFFWGHGRHDTSIPYDLARQGRAQLRAAGADLTIHDYDIGHWIDSQELKDARQFLSQL